MARKRRRGRKTSVIRWAAVSVVLLLTVAFLIPVILVNHIGGFDASRLTSPLKTRLKLQTGDSQINVPIYLTREKRIETVPLEYYVRGVLAAEMPADFSLEALKAQALAARTYIVRRIHEGHFSGVPVKGAWVTDTVAHQAYATEEQLKKNWGLFAYGSKMDRLTQAVNETAGRIITYDHQPIDATFFSTSNGYTENSEDYWTTSIPYLRSVPSPWDVEQSPKYKHTVMLKLNDVLQKLGVGNAVPVSTAGRTFQVLSTSAGHRIKTIRIAGHIFTGRDVREKLELPSSQFTWKVDKETITFTTYGYGHGVGMSQYGANALAEQGKTAEDIVRYYYQGVELESASSFLGQHA